MNWILHVENAETIRAGMRGVVRRLGSQYHLFEAANLAEARTKIRLMGSARIHAAVLDWSLPDGCASALIPLIGSARVIVLSAHELDLPGMTVVRKDPSCFAVIEGMLRA